MLAWLANNTATILIAFVLIAVVTVIVVHLVKNKKKGQSSCGCGCRDCPMSGACHQKNNGRSRGTKSRGSFFVRLPLRPDRNDHCPHFQIVVYWL